MPRKRTSTPTSCVLNGREIPVETASTPPPPLSTTPENSLLRSSSGYAADIREGRIELSQVDLFEIEKRVGLLSRVVIEAALLGPMLSVKEKADIALRAITVLEGSKQQVEWRTDMLRKEPSKNALEVEAEMKQREERLMRILTRRKQLQIAQAEAAIIAAQQVKANQQNEDN